MKQLLLFSFIILSHGFVHVFNKDSIFEKYAIPNHLKTETYAAPSQRSPSPKDIAGLRDYIQNGIMTCNAWQIPGLSVTVVQGTKTVFLSGFGYENIQTKKPVTENTVFNIGSVSKSFTSTAMAMLLDEKLVDLDQPIIDSLLPTFRLKDNYRTLQVTLRDMGSHRTGMPRNDFIWASYSKIERAELVRRLQFLDFNIPFRTELEYNNLIWTAIGYILGNVQGISWEQLITSRVLKPLSMANSTVFIEEALQSPHYATPYGITNDGKVMPFPRDANKVISLIGPAGGVISTAKDMSNYLKLHINKGNFNGQPLVSYQSLSEMYKPTIGFPGVEFTRYFLSYGPDPLRPTFPVSFVSESGGLGWIRAEYRGHRVLWHAGAVIGFSSMNVVFPDDNIGVTMLTNIESNLVGIYIAWQAFDLLMGYEPWLNKNNTCNFPCGFIKCERQEGKRDNSATSMSSSTKISNAQPYVDTYTNHAYGTVSITSPDGQNLFFQWNEFKGQMFPTNGTDTFVIQLVAPVTLDPVPVPVQFGRNFQGNVDSFNSPFEPALPPTVFTNQKYKPKLCTSTDIP